ncbi:16774_t:CDS:2, partial [Dentiscutata erythropus]
GKQLDNSGHYEAICKVYEKLFSSRKLSIIENYIISEYKLVSEKLDEFLESTAISEKLIESINRALIKVF